MCCCVRLKKDGQTTKEVPLIRSGFNAFIDHLFWYLAFSSVKQAATVLENLEDFTSADWDTKRQELRDEHPLERASNDLIDGWKAWIVEHGPNKSCSAPRMERPADWLTSITRD